MKKYLLTTTLMVMIICSTTDGMVATQSPIAATQTITDKELLQKIDATKIHASMVYVSQSSEPHQAIYTACCAALKKAGLPPELYKCVKERYKYYLRNTYKNGRNVDKLLAISTIALIDALQAILEDLSVAECLQSLQRRSLSLN